MSVMQVDIPALKIIIFFLGKGWNAEEFPKELDCHALKTHHGTDNLNSAFIV
jgi:hypothetical protein